jgi:hypothetical protein
MKTDGLYSQMTGVTRLGRTLQTRGTRVSTNGDETYSEDFLKSSSLYSEHLARKEEVNKHKWYESERAGRDVGIDYAFFDWLLKHSNQWRTKA